MNIALDGQGTKHAQLTRALRAGITAGLYEQGERLPASRDFALQLGLSRNTVRTAFAQLQDEGLIQSRSGAGSVVAHRVHRMATTKSNAKAPAGSRFAARLRGIDDFSITRRASGLRYNLQYGESVLDPVALTAWRSALSKAAQLTPTSYPHPQGLEPLRQAISHFLRRHRSLSCTPDDILIVNGTQQAMALCAQVLIDEGGVVALEDPHYFAARHLFQAHGARLVYAPVDEQGLVLTGLKRHAPRLVMVTPSNQFPGGGRMSVARRLQLLEFSHAKQTWIFEDDYDSEFCFDRDRVPALRAMDAERVIYAGSFSKVIFPSLRLGYMVMPTALKSNFVRAKRVADLGSPAIEQAAMARYMDSGAFERHLRRNVKLVGERRATILDGLRKLDVFDIQDSKAGMHLVAWMPRHSRDDLDRLISDAQRCGLGLYPIQPHYHRSPAVPGLLVGYAGLSPKQIEQALGVLTTCLARLAG